MNSEQISKYSEQVVAFVDILAFKTIIQSIENNKNQHARLHWALTHIHLYKKTYERSNTANSNLEISVFSDCIVVTGEISEIHNVIWAVGWLQANLLPVGILTRGGISKGKVFHAGGILYGEGMIKAYHIEKSAAVYPRIVIDPELTNLLPEKYKSVFLIEDSDGLSFVDPFTFGATTGNVEALVEDGWDPHEIYLDEVEKHIMDGINSSKKVDHIAKWNWLKFKHLVAKKDYKKTRTTKLWQLTDE